MKLLRRHAAAQVKRLLEVFPVVALTGARQTGKSTLAQVLIQDLGGTYLTLDDPAVLARALEDPQGFVARRDGPLVIDEVQRAPDLLPAIKLAVDRDRWAALGGDAEPGARYILTGSANVLRMRSTTESLAGRAAWLELGPLTWSEVTEAECPTTIENAFGADTAAGFVKVLRAPPTGFADDARRRCVRGGMPATLELDPDELKHWYEGYRTAFLERDLRQLGQIENLPEFGRLMTIALARTGGVLNRRDLASDAGLAYQTLRRYLNILEVAYQVHELPPYFVNVGKRLRKSPKLYALDSGLAAFAGNVRDWNDAVSLGREGVLFETWAVNELRTLDGLCGPQAQAFYWRTSAGTEVDLVLERGSAVVGIEIKASATITRRDLTGLRALREDLGSRFRLGIVAYLGETAEPLDRTLCAVPVASLLGVAAA